MKSPDVWSWQFTTSEDWDKREKARWVETWQKQIGQHNIKRELLNVQYHYKYYNKNHLEIQENNVIQEK